MTDLVKIAERRMNNLRERRRVLLNAVYEAEDNLLSDTSIRQALEDEGCTRRRSRRTAHGSYSVPCGTRRVGGSCANHARRAAMTVTFMDDAAAPHAERSAATSPPIQMLDDDRSG
jgi:hypothetical protein